MAKWRPIGSMADSSHLTFEQLETSFESSGGHENDEHIPRIYESSDRHRERNVSQRDRLVHNPNHCSQSHRSRAHYPSGHHCNGHQNHHQYHQQCCHSSHCPMVKTSSSGHSNWCCHQHIQHRNSHSNQCNQELVVNEEVNDTQPSHSGHGLSSQMNYTLDSSEFERIWRQLESNRDRYHFLQTLYRSSGSLIFSEICFGSLGDIASALSEFDQTVDDFVFVIYILNSLSRAKRFLLSLQFLTIDEQSSLRQLFVRLWKGMNDIRQDLAENDISELTITALMKAYEIDIDS